MRGYVFGEALKSIYLCWQTIKQNIPLKPGKQ
jgi:hypothetical protein